ncbi:MAG: hypothetical protein ACLUH5_05945 [Eubacterium sp.]
MLTVLAIDRNLMNELDDFETLFSNVQNKGNFRICCWNREGKNLVEAIPALFDRHFLSENELRDWNIMIVSDDRNCTYDNPFGGDYLLGKENLPDPELNEVAKMLGIVPTNSHSWYELPKSKFGSIKWGVDVSRTLRDEKLREYNVFEFSRPQKIYLVSVVKKTDVDIDGFTKPKTNTTYFDFRIKAKYPVNCRFLKFNLSSVSNSNTKEDYFRLWMTVLTFIYNDPDSIFLSPDAMYNMDSVIDKKVMQRQISTIFSKVHFVKKYANVKIQDIKVMREYIKQKHYDFPNLDSSISIQFDVNDDGLLLNLKRFGLAKNCPCEDNATYSSQREMIDKKIFNFLKAPKRALKKAVCETKNKGKFVPDSEEKIHMDEEQTEDLIYSINDMELALFGEDSVNIDYERKNAEERNVCDEENYKTMKKRSTVSVIVFGSLIAFFAVFIGFIPYIINAFVTKNNETIADSFMVTSLSLLVLAIAGIITLIVLKVPLLRGLKKFNNIMKKLVKQTVDLADQYTVYLSKLSSFMKRNSFKTYLDCNDNVYMREEELKLEKNINFSDLKEEACQNWADMFNFKLKYNEKYIDESFYLDEYPEKNPVFSFKIKSGDFRVLLNGKPSNLVTPYEFIKVINITLEENA